MKAGAPKHIEDSCLAEIGVILKNCSVEQIEAFHRDLPAMLKSNTWKYIIDACTMKGRWITNDTDSTQLQQKQ